MDTEMLMLESDLDCRNTEGMRDTIDYTTYFDYEIAGDRLEVKPVCTYITFDQEWWDADIKEMARVGVEGYVIIVKVDSLEITRFDLSDHIIDQEGTIIETPCIIVMAEEARTEMSAVKEKP